MPRVRAFFAFFALFVALWAGSAAASTPDEAKALGDKAATLLAKEGSQAFAAFRDPKGEFIKGDLYITVIDRKGVIQSHPNAKLIGVNMWEATDTDGVKFTQEAWKAVEHVDAAWQTPYKFTNPVTRKLETKKAWVHKVGDYVVICGVYVKS
jgi:cytochrome c